MSGTRPGMTSGELHQIENYAALDAGGIASTA